MCVYYFLSPVTHQWTFRLLPWVWLSWIVLLLTWVCTYLYYNYFCTTMAELMSYVRRSRDYMSFNPKILIWTFKEKFSELYPSPIRLSKALISLSAVFPRMEISGFLFLCYLGLVIPHSLARSLMLLGRTFLYFTQLS